MKKILLPVLSLSLCFLSCNKEDAAALPSCIQEWIEAVKKENTWNPPATVKEYRYNGKKVYLLTPDCCDQYAILLDEHCNYICAPDGGISGKGDGKCLDFYEKAELVKEVWKDGR